MLFLSLQAFFAGPFFPSRFHPASFNTSSTASLVSDFAIAGVALRSGRTRMQNLRRGQEQNHQGHVDVKQQMGTALLLWLGRF